MKQLTGTALQHALDERNISTEGLPKTGTGSPTEASMQAALAEYLQDERDELLLTATSNLADFTKKLVWATWAVAFAGASLVIATGAQIYLVLIHYR